MSRGDRHRRLRPLVAGLERQGAVVAIWPDHPLLLHGPDILLAADGRLSALFVPTAAERRRLQDLRARCALSRLALPSGSRSVLVADALTIQQLSRDFDRSIPEGRAAADAIREFFESDEPSLRAIPDEIREAVWSRFAMADRPRGDDQLVSSDGVAWVSTARKNVSGLWRIDERYELRIDEVPSRHAAIGRLDRAVRFVFADEFRIDNGVPYPVGDLQLIHHIVGAERLTRRSFDSLKPLRAAAFAGWSSDRAS